MTTAGFDAATMRKLESFQRNEITEYLLYRWLAQRTREPKNREVFARLAADEKRHYEEWKKHSGREVSPDRLRILWFQFLTRLLGFTFVIKKMEGGEDDSGAAYRELSAVVPNVETIAKEEDEHERALMDMLDEERLRYVGSIVLGLNDALVELTGALAGLTLALQNTRLIAMTGAITGIAAALSMAASEYLSVKTEASGQNPIRAALYTGATYILTVVLLVLPYLFSSNYYVALGCTLGLAVLIIAFFNYYVAVARDLSFRKRFLEMALLSLSVAAFSFGVGYVMRVLFGVEI
jgi:VIT1/CCC1 family predicted Fe2+/Mn2+ transporter